MACKTVDAIIPKSVLSIPNVAELLSTVTQIDATAVRDWKGARVLRAALFLTNPANLALVKSLLNLRTLGDLAKLTALTNLLRYAGMEGIVDMSKLSGKVSSLTEAVDCVVKNIDALQALQSNILRQVQEALSLSQVYKALGISDALERLGVMDSYLFAQLNREMSNKIGFSRVSSLPYLSGSIPTSELITKSVQATYTANSLLQTLYLLQESTEDADAESVLNAAGSVGGMYAPSALFSDGLPVSAHGPTVLLNSIESMSPLQAVQGVVHAEHPLGSALSVSSTPSTPISPGVPPTIEDLSGSTRTLGQDTVTSLQRLGRDGMGVLQDAIEKEVLLLPEREDGIALQKRAIAVQLRKWRGEFVRVDTELEELRRALSSVQVDGANPDDISPLLADLQTRNSSLLETWRVLDFRVKCLEMELRQVGAGRGAAQAAARRLRTWSSSLGTLGAGSVYTYTSRDARTVGSRLDKEQCGWVRLTPVQVTTPSGSRSVVSLTFRPEANNPVHPAFKDWFDSLVRSVAAKMFLSTLHVSSTTEGRHSRTSWHYKGGAVDISGINGVSVTSLGASSPVRVLQTDAISLGARECKGPVYGADMYHKNHIHVSRIVPSSVCTGAISQQSTPQNTPLAQDP